MDRSALRPSGLTVAVLFALLLAMSLVVPVLPTAAEDFPPTMYVTVDGEDQFNVVDVSFGRVTVTVRGLVEVEKDSVKPETIRLSVEGTSWGFTMSPPEETVTGAVDSFRFTAAIFVPGDTAEGEYTGRIMAAWTDSLGENRVEVTDEFRVRVINMPFNAYADPIYMLMDPGDTMHVKVTISDRSPTGYTYLAQVGEVTTTEPVGWLDWALLWLDTDRLDIDAGGIETVSLEVTVPSNATEGTMKVPVTVMVEGHPEYTKKLEITVQVQGAPIEPPVPPDTPWWPFDPMLLFYILTIIFAVGFIGFFGFTEVGLLYILWAVPFILFTRIKKQQVLNQFKRGEIYGFIKANPGVHLTAIKENLGMANGVLAYHLKVLIREEFIVARREGGYKRFYPRDMKVPRKRVHFTRLQLDIVERLSMHPGSTQASLARMLGESKQVINYNVGVLVAAGVIRVTREGSKTLLYIEDGTALHPQVQVAELVEEGDPEEDGVPKGTPAPVRWQ
jgi:predicted transcriptional regulator